MSESIILHHRYTSPFSEKIRLLLGFVGISWQSVHAPFYPPRPAIDPLVGGYRKIPVAQLGADIFCDSRIICDEISRLANRPELSPFNQLPTIASRIRRIETEIFYACMASSSPLGLLRMMRRLVPPRHWIGYIKDKKNILATNVIELPERDIAKGAWENFLNQLETELKSVEYLSGSSSPSLLDFTALQFIWFRVQMEGVNKFRKHNHLFQWYQKLLGIGHGDMYRIKTSDSLKSVEDHTPRRLVDEFLTSNFKGERVKITPDDMMPVSTRGTLVGENDHRWIISRTLKQGNEVHVHFPKEGFCLEVVE